MSKRYELTPVSKEKKKNKLKLKANTCSDSMANSLDREST